MRSFGACCHASWRAKALIQQLLAFPNVLKCLMQGLALIAHQLRGLLSKLKLDIEYGEPKGVGNCFAVAGAGFPPAHVLPKGEAHVVTQEALLKPSSTGLDGSLNYTNADAVECSLIR